MERQDINIRLKMKIIKNKHDDLHVFLDETKGCAKTKSDKNRIQGAFKQFCNLAIKSNGSNANYSLYFNTVNTKYSSFIALSFAIPIQESLADAKVSARQQCVYEDPYRRNLQQICN